MGALPWLAQSQLWKGSGTLGGYDCEGQCKQGWIGDIQGSAGANGGREGSPFQGTPLKGQAVFWSCHLVHAKGKQLLLGRVLCLDTVQEKIILGTE